MEMRTTALGRDDRFARGGSTTPSPPSSTGGEGRRGLLTVAGAAPTWLGSGALALALAGCIDGRGAGRRDLLAIGPARIEGAAGEVLGEGREPGPLLLAHRERAVFHLELAERR